jgi:hypothetical protein
LKFGPYVEYDIEYSDEYDAEQDYDEHDQTGEKHSQPCLAKNAAAKY